MSVFTPIRGFIEPPTTTTLTTTNATTILSTTGIGYRRIVKAISIANVDASNACICLLQWNDGSSNYTFWNGDIAAKSSTVLDSIPLMLDVNGAVRELKATASAADDLVITVITMAIQQQDERGESWR
jgi:hypothetical protein